MKKRLISVAYLLTALALLISCSTAIELSEHKPKPVQEQEALSVPILMESDWLTAKGAFSKLRLIDSGRKIEDYQAGHIPGAVFVDRKVAWTKVDGVPGMLPYVDTMVQELENSGISSDSMVVIYDNSGGLWASRLFWALEYLGHRDVHILNGGWHKWVQEKRDVQTASSVFPRGKFVPRIQHDLLTNKEWILGNMSNPEVRIIDTRSPKEYAGEDVRAARGGHIPGAININWISNLKGDDSKTIAIEGKLVELYDPQKISKDKIIVTHCQTGVRGAHTYFVLKLLGYPKVRVYDGSWAEWGNDREAPVIR